MKLSKSKRCLNRVKWRYWKLLFLIIIYIYIRSDFRQNGKKKSTINNNNIVEKDKISTYINNNSWEKKTEETLCERNTTNDRVETANYVRASKYTRANTRIRRRARTRLQLSCLFRLWPPNRKRTLVASLIRLKCFLSHIVFPHIHVLVSVRRDNYHGIISLFQAISQALHVTLSIVRESLFQHRYKTSTQTPISSYLIVYRM